MICPTKEHVGEEYTRTRQAYIQFHCQLTLQTKLIFSNFGTKQEHELKKKKRKLVVNTIIPYLTRNKINSTIITILHFLHIILQNTMAIPRTSRSRLIQNMILFEKKYFAVDKSGII